MKRDLVFLPICILIAFLTTSFVMHFRIMGIPVAATFFGVALWGYTRRYTQRRLHRGDHKRLAPPGA